MFDWPHRVYTIGWVIWVLWFMVLEAAAVVDRHKGDTFTEHVAWFMWHDRKPTLVFFLVAAVTVWLVWHFVFESVKWGRVFGP